MGDVLLWILSGGLMVGVLVIVHEAGHYVVARLFGVGTPVFSIGFGPRVFGFRFWETDFRISLLPFGGYVRMAGADPFGEELVEDYVDPDEDFMGKPVWQRFLVMLAGPAANLILPFVLFTAVLMLGEPQSDTTVGNVRPGSTAEQLGFQIGDQIVEVDGEPVDTWLEVLRSLDGREAAAAVAVQRGEERLSVTLPPSAVEGTAFRTLDAFGLFHSSLSSRIGVSDPTSPAWRAGLRPGDEIVEVDGSGVVTFHELSAALSPGRDHALVVHRAGAEPERIELSLSPVPGWSPAADEVLPDPWGLIPGEVFVGEVLPGSAADEAGVAVGDRLVGIDGTRIWSWDDVLGLVGATTEGLDLATEAPLRSGGCNSEPLDPILGRALDLSLVRDGEPLTLTFQPRVQREVVISEVTYRPIMGVKHLDRASVSGPETVKYYGLTEAFPRAVDDGGEVLRNTMTVLGNLLRGKLKPKESLGGPIEIVRTAGYAAQEGFFTFARVMGMISFSLGIVNLLPVPVLDGGQILFYAIEGIRGRPLPLLLRERIQMVGVLFLAALMVMVLVMDIGRWLEG